MISKRLLISGGGTSAHEMYLSLDVKHLQLDSLGFIHCARLATTGLFTLCTNLYDTTLKFFATNYRDVSINYIFNLFTSILIKKNVSEYGLLNTFI